MIHDPSSVAATPQTGARSVRGDGYVLRRVMQSYGFEGFGVIYEPKALE